MDCGSPTTGGLRTGSDHRRAHSLIGANLVMVLITAAAGATTTTGAAVNSPGDHKS